MLQAGHCPRFDQVALDVVGVGHPFWQGHLDHDWSLQLIVAAQVHETESTLAQNAFNGIPADPVRDRQRRQGLFDHQDVFGKTVLVIGCFGLFAPLAADRQLDQQQFFEQLSALVGIHLNQELFDSRRLVILPVGLKLVTDLIDLAVVVLRWQFGVVRTWLIHSRHVS